MPGTDYLPISALQHLVFCERQCALIHIEGLWAENRLTVEGRILHRRAHGEDRGPRGGGRAQSRPGARAVLGLSLCSNDLRLSGTSDVVEFIGRTSDAGKGQRGVPFPVEFKRGKPKKHDADQVQLCAQAMCLEEMLGLPRGGVPAGAIFYGLTRHRLDVSFDHDLRARTAALAERLHRLVGQGVTPRARREKKCDRCSLRDLCLPDGTGPERSARRYLENSHLGTLEFDSPPAGAAPAGLLPEGPRPGQA